MNEERPKLTLIQGNSESKNAATEERERAEEYEHLVYTHKCGIEEKPRWCIRIDDDKGGKTVLYWIRPDDGDELVARRIAKYLNSPSKLRDSASAEMTKWNPKLKSEPAHAEHENFNDEPPPLAA